ncbi:hypothetical protein HDU76_006470 [Blyttiomyces sp. JEL0837]|nr:hypothetical protein HDU76_006470 [Blyttiomyces sp. JEL0837]
MPRESRRYELQGQNYYRHFKSISPGLEEYIEAFSFYHYMRTGELVSREAIQDELQKAADGPVMPITVEDYVNGLADLTGELMRLAINTVARGQHQSAAKICSFMRKLASDYDILNYPPARKKMSAMKSSLVKVETACYNIKVRGSEYPQARWHEVMQRSLTYGNEEEYGEENNT